MAAPVPVGTIVIVPLTICGGTIPEGMCSIVPDGIGATEPVIVLAAGITSIDVDDITGNSLEGLKPLQRPPLQMLYAH